MTHDMTIARHALAHDGLANVNDLGRLIAKTMDA
jgi:hypothetical protein